MRRVLPLFVAVALGAVAAGGPVLAGAAPPAARPGPQDIDGLLAALAAMPGLYAEFREEKHMALLAAPLVNEGTLHYHGGMLARHTTTPMRSSLVVRDGRLEFGDATGREQLDLRANPVVRLFVDSFVRILAGDRVALERMYEMRFAPVDAAAGTWSLVLRPKVAPMSGVIDRLELQGQGIEVRSMLVVETGGDRTATTFSHVDVRRHYGAAESRRIFAIPAP